MTFLHFLLICGEKDEGRADLSTIKDLIEDTIVSTKPAMTVNLMAITAGASAVSRSPRVILVPQTQAPRRFWGSRLRQESKGRVTLLGNSRILACTVTGVWVL